MVVMKKAVVLLVICISFSLFVSAQKYNFESLVGNWRNKQGAGLEVVDSAHIYLVYGDKRKQVVSFQADFSVNPAQFNFLVKESSNSASYKSKLLFVRENLIQWQIFESEAKPIEYKETKPVKYKEPSDLLILRKIEERNN
jgi:hypothetical protein